VGTLEDGFLRITDRKKDIIVTAGGKNIAPQPIENAAKTSKFVAHAVMIGDRRRYPILLVVPEWEPLERWAREAGLTWSSRAALVALPAVRENVESEVRATFGALASFETPKKIVLLDQDFTIERELTPKLSVRRRVVDQRYRALIESAYASD